MKKNKIHVFLVILVLIVGTGIYLFVSDSDSANSYDNSDASKTVYGSISSSKYGSYGDEDSKNKKPVKSATITFTKKGYSPESVILKNGGTVEFINKSDGSMWPATDAHPTHTYYDNTSLKEHCNENNSSFDSCEEISPDESWSFTFDKAGRWRFHDHINPSLDGVVVVSDEEGDFATLNEYVENCDRTEGKCFDAFVRKIVREEGVEAGYSILRDAFDSGENPRSCHWTAHQIGAAAYNLFKEGKEFPISKATSYCGYGFYHEFLEHLLRDDPGAINEVLNFCKEVENQLGKMGLWNCYHGIGHGQTNDPPLEKHKGNPEAMMKKGKETCSRIFKDNYNDFNLCMTGVFTVIAHYAEKGDYGLSIPEEDPFRLCKKQPYRYKKACYGEYGADVASDTDFWLPDLIPHLKEINDAKTRRLLVWVAPTITMGRDFDKSDIDLSKKYKDGCNAFPGRYYNICLAGSIYGIFSNAKPGEQYKNVLDFCDSSYFTHDDRKLCYQNLYHRMNQSSAIYTKDKVENVCSKVPHEYEEYCPNEDYIPPYDDPIFDEPEPTKVEF